MACGLGSNSAKCLQGRIVQMAVGGQNAAVLGERAAVGEIERLAVEIGDSAARFFDDDRAGRLVPNLLAVVGPGGRSSRSSTSPSPAARTAYLAWLSIATGGAVTPEFRGELADFVDVRVPFRPSGGMRALVGSVIVDDTEVRCQVCSPESGCCQVPCRERRRDGTAGFRLRPGCVCSKDGQSGQPRTPIFTFRLFDQRRARRRTARGAEIPWCRRWDRASRTFSSVSPLPRSIRPQTSSGVASGGAVRTNA